MSSVPWGLLEDGDWFWFCAIDIDRGLIGCAATSSEFWASIAMGGLYTFLAVWRLCFRESLRLCIAVVREDVKVRLDEVTGKPYWMSVSLKLWARG